MPKLFSEFKESSFKEWKNKVHFDLNGLDFNSTMVWKNNEGIDIPPYLTSDYEFKKLDLKGFAHSKTKGAKIFHLTSNPKSLSIFKNLLRDKIDSLILYVPKNYKIDSILSAVDKIRFDIQFVFEDFDFQQIRQLNKLSTKLIKGKKIFLNLDPISDFVETGKWKHSSEFDLNQIQKLSNELNPNIYPISVSGDLYQNAGANISQQIAISLSIAVEYANLLGGSFLNKIQFRLAISSNFFFEIAKIKVLRHLLSLVKNEYKLKGSSEIYTETSLRNKSIYSSHNNLIRTSSEAFAALLGGVDTLFIHPHDYIYNHPNSNSSRIAYNQFNVLKEEVLNDVENPLNGNYLLDFINSELAKKSLELFKSIENSGGFIENVYSNNIQKKVIEASKKEQSLFDNNDLLICGVNYSVNEDERISDFIRKFPFRKMRNNKVDIITLSKVRLAEKIEKDRLASEKN